METAQQYVRDMLIGLTIESQPVRQSVEKRLSDDDATEGMKELSEARERPSTVVLDEADQETL